MSQLGKISINGSSKMRIVVNGLGEMGASLALAIKNGQENAEIIGVDLNVKTLQRAKEIGLADEVNTDLFAVAPTADVIILATPIHIIIDSLHKLSHADLKSTVLITDTGSTKKQVMDAANELINNGTSFVGGHAMAGTAKAGIDALDAHLYDSAPYFLVSENQADLDRLRNLLSSLHLNFVETTAKKHDEMMAMLSDLPHIVAASLVNASSLTLANHPELPQYAAGGFKDTTRIGGADPQMWTDILQTNRDATLEAIELYQQQIDTLKQALINNNSTEIFDFFAASKQTRMTMEEDF